MFFIAYSCYIFFRYRSQSLIDEMIPDYIYKFVNFSIIFFALFSIIIRNKVSKKYLILSMVLIAISVVVYIKTGQNSFLFIISLMLAAYNIPFSKIVIWSVVNNVFWFISTFICSICGLIPDNTYSHKDVLGNMVMAHSYGFNHYSSASFIVLYVSIMVVFLLRNNLKIKYLIVVYSVNIITALIFTTRMPLVLSTVFVLLVFLEEKFNFINFTSKKWMGMAIAVPILLSVLSLYYTKYYRPSNLIMYVINMATSKRLEMGQRVINTYNLKLFGQHIPMYGTYSRIYGANPNQEYFYLDNGYLYLFYEYGLVFSFIILFSLIVLFLYSNRSKDEVLYIWILILMLFGLLNSTFLNIEYNPCLLAVMSVLVRFRKDKNWRID